MRDDIDPEGTFTIDIFTSRDGTVTGNVMFGDNTVFEYIFTGDFDVSPGSFPRYYSRRDKVASVFASRLKSLLEKVEDDG
jgi:hypothetical protein